MRFKVRSAATMSQKRLEQAVRYSLVVNRLLLVILLVVLIIGSIGPLDGPGIIVTIALSVVFLVERIDYQILSYELGRRELTAVKQNERQ